MIKIKQISVPTLVENGEVFIVEDGKIAFSGAVATGLKIPAGTTAERPVTVESGFVRYNTTISSLEVFNGTVWLKVGSTDVITSEDGLTYVSTTETNDTVVISTNGTSKLLVSAAEDDVALTATGSATNIDVNINPKGAGQINAPSNYVPTDEKSLVTKDYADKVAIPAGGTSGEVLKKKSDTDYDVDWEPETKVQVVDSSTVDFTGNGYETPLSASVIISPNAGNMVTNNSGIFVPAELPNGGTTHQVLRKLSNANRDVVWADVINNSIGITYYVDTHNGSDSFPGSFDMPFKTIQKAHDIATATDTYIVVAPGTYDEDLIITKGIFIEGSAALGSSNVVIRGLITIGNGVIPRLRFKNVNIDAEVGNPDTVVFTNSTGKVFFDNVNINANAGTNAVRFDGSAVNWFTLNGDITGKIKIPSTLTTTDMVFIYIIDGTDRPTVELENENVLVFIERGTMGSITHTAGHLYVANTISVGGLNSTANDGSIRFINSSFFDMETGYFTSTKTGNCTYIFENSSKNPVEAWVGTKINLSDAEFIDVNYVSVNYTPVAKDITSNVKAIDSALGDLRDYIDYDAVIVTADTIVTAEQSRTVFIVNNDSSKITLPLVATVPVGFKVMVKDGFGVTTTPIVIEAAVNEVIDGANVQVIEYAFESVTVVNDGTKWLIV